MKRFGMTTLFIASVLFSFGQHAGLSEISSTPADKILLVQNSVDIPSWHEKRFWSLYDKYEKVNEQVALSCYRALNDFAKMDGNVSPSEALDFAEKLIKFRNDQFVTRSTYYSEMASEFNGVIAFQFLQAETLIDIMESAKIYEQSRWRNFRFNRKALPSTQTKYAKYNTIVTAIDLMPEKAGAFYQIYYQYEQELDAILGEDYSMYSLFAGEPSDLTPGLAKTSGHNFLLVMKRELNLKERYFRKMNDHVGPVLAARFLAWEDYYSLNGKMQAWVENQ